MVHIVLYSQLPSNNNYTKYAVGPTGCCGHRPIRLLNRYLYQLIVLFEPMVWTLDSSLYRPLGLLRAGGVCGREGHPPPMPPRQMCRRPVILVVRAVDNTIPAPQTGVLVNNQGVRPPHSTSISKKLKQVR